MNPRPTRISGPTRIAISLTHSRRPLAEQIAEARTAGADMVELRCDRIGLRPARELLRDAQPLETILTVRERDEGGEWDGTLDEKLDILCEIAARHVDFVDVEWALWQHSPVARERLGRLCGQRTSDAAPLRSPKLILSHHDHRGTPDHLDRLVRKIRASPADVIKIVSTAHDAADALLMMDLVRRHSADGPIIGLAMGAGGLASRILCRKAGAFLTFAAMRAGEESAPGQPTIDALKSRYRWDDLDLETEIFGLIGHPVAHSHGPAIHNAAMARDGINGVYVPFLVSPDEAGFARFMSLAGTHPDLRGLSVTLPHKTHAIRWLESTGGRVSAMARRCGAVNTLVYHGGVWRGDNTDAPAAIAALRTVAAIRDAGFDGLNVDILGAGGVARAVLAALSAAGCRLTIWNRTPDTAAALAAELGCQLGAWDRRSEAGGRVLINCTSVGMTPHESHSPFPAHALARFEAVFDTVYTPTDTRLLRDARQTGIATVSGLEMFIAQAELQYRIWHDRPPARDAMRLALAGR